MLNIAEMQLHIVKMQLHFYKMKRHIGNMKHDFNDIKLHINKMKLNIDEMTHHIVEMKCNIVDMTLHFNDLKINYLRQNYLVFPHLNVYLSSAGVTLMKSLLVLAVLLLSFTFANAQHEYAPFEEHEIKYKDWTYKSVRDDAGETNLRDFARGKKLVMVVYFAAWCPNWRNEAPIAQKLYEKYRANGFDVIGVSEYASVEDTKKNLDTLKITFPVVAESDSRDAKQKTPHYDYRKETGDTRSWGSPWNIFLEEANLENKGDTLLKKAFVVNGELIEDETEKFIRRKLGLPAEETKAQIGTKEKPIETCEPDKKDAAFKKP